MPRRVCSRAFSILAISLASLATACGTKPNPGGDCPLLAPPVTYSASIKPFIDVHCLSCHNKKTLNRQGAPIDVNFDTYSDVKANGVPADQSILGGRMPPNSSLNNDLRCMFDAWVRGNYLE